MSSVANSILQCGMHKHHAFSSILANCDAFGSLAKVFTQNATEYK